jgi:excisionase family DNA binding protein
MKTAKVVNASEKLAYNVPEMAAMLGVGLPAAYNLCNRADFPALKVGGRYIIPKQALEHWLNSQCDE